MRKILLEIKKGPKYWYEEMIKAKVGPFEIALGFSIGVFCSMLALPIVNFFLALLATALFRVNKLAVMIGYFLVFWPLSPFIYYASLRLGSILFGHALTISVKDISFGLIKNYVAMFAAGNLLLSALTAAAAFFAAYSITKLIGIIKNRRKTVLPPGDGAT